MNLLSKLHKNSILTGSVDSYCLVCDSYLRCEEEAYAHADKPVHKKNLDAAPRVEKYKDERIIKVKKGYYCIFCNLLLSTVAKVGLHVSDAKHHDSKAMQMLSRVGDVIVAFDDLIISKEAWNGLIENTCMVCNEEFDDAEEHTNEPGHVLKLIQSKCEFGDEYVYRKVDEDSFFCLICIGVFTINDKPTHHELKMHKDVYKSSKDVDHTIINANYEKDKIRNQTKSVSVMSTNVSENASSNTIKVVQPKTEPNITKSVPPNAPETTNAQNTTPVNAPRTATQNERKTEAPKVTNIVQEPNIASKNNNNAQTDNNGVKNAATQANKKKKNKKTTVQHLAIDTKQDTNETKIVTNESKQDTNQSKQVNSDTKQVSNELVTLTKADEVTSAKTQIKNLQKEHLTESPESITKCANNKVTSIEEGKVDVHKILPNEDVKDFRKEQGQPDKIDIDKIQNVADIYENESKPISFTVDKTALVSVIEADKSIPQASSDSQKEIEESEQKSQDDDKLFTKMLIYAKRFNENEIVLDFQTKSAHCNQCNVDLPFNIDLMNDHIEISHEKVEDEETQEINEAVSIYADENHILFIGKNYHCEICDINIDPVLKTMKEHVATDSHKDKTVKKTGRLPITKVLMTNFLKTLSRMESFFRKDIVINNKYVLSINSFLCVVENGPEVMCALCEEDMAGDQVFQHYGTDKHRDYTEECKVISGLDNEFVRELKPSIYHCGFCNCVEHTWSEMEAHLTTTAHKEAKHSALWNLERYMPSLRNIEPVEVRSALMIPMGDVYS